MSTPVDLNIVMPYGYTVGGRLDAVWQGRVDGGGAHVDLPEGPCRVMASWSGPEKAALTLVNPDKRTVLAEIPAQAGGGRAILGWLQSVLSRATRCASKLHPAPQPTRPAPSRSTRYPACSYPQGGGVDGHPEHRSGRAAGNQIVRSSDRGRERESDRRGQFLPGSAGGRFHHHGQRGAVEPGRALSNHGLSVGTLRVADNISGTDNCVVERGGARWRDALPAHQGEQCLRRGSDYHHLPAVAVGGGCGK